MLEPERVLPHQTVVAVVAVGVSLFAVAASFEFAVRRVPTEGHFEWPAGIGEDFWYFKNRSYPRHYRLPHVATGLTLGLWVAGCCWFAAARHAPRAVRVARCATLAILGIAAVSFLLIDHRYWLLGPFRPRPPAP